ncbi:hypothetical protein C8J36_11437 [Rhizobium sp. PP-F2F-G48]|nr:hypothetical protein C8J36_11437 [Rhizobium sp. PP-F2F-G48]
MSATSRHRIPETNPHPATVFRDELDTCLFKFGLDVFYGFRSEIFTSLQPTDRLRRNSCCIRQISDAPTQRYTCQFALNSIHITTPL